MLPRTLGFGSRKLRTWMSFQCGMLRLRWNLNPGAYCGGTTGIGHFGNRECPCTKMSSEKRASRCWFNQQAPSHSRVEQTFVSSIWTFSVLGSFNVFWPLQFIVVHCMCPCHGLGSLTRLNPFQGREQLLERARGQIGRAGSIACWKDCNSAATTRCFGGN